jgi:hypothetical protein
MYSHFLHTTSHLCCNVSTKAPNRGIHFLFCNQLYPLNQKFPTMSYAVRKKRTIPAMWPYYKQSIIGRSDRAHGMLRIMQGSNKNLRWV